MLAVCSRGWQIASASASIVKPYPLFYTGFLEKRA
jgi:hypothetical protein